MKRLRLKLFIAVLAFIVGVCVSYVFLSFAQSKANSQITDVPSFVGNRSGEIKVRFVQFLKSSDSSIAEFELFNDTQETIKYQGYNSKNSYCTLAVKRADVVELTNVCSCGVGRGFHSLGSGQAITYQISKWELPDALREQNQDVTAQFGFKVLLSEENREEIIWSDEITLSK